MKQFRLRKLTLGDVDSIALYANDEDVGRFLTDGFPFPYTRQDAQSFIGNMLASDESKVLHRTIEIDGKAVGSIGVFKNTDVYRKSAKIGYWLAKPYWGKGVMSGAVKLLSPLAFSTFNVVRLEAEIFSPNKISQKVLSHAGYEFEGTKKSSVFKRGVLMDSEIFALIARHDYSDVMDDENFLVRRLNCNDTFQLSGMFACKDLVSTLTRDMQECSMDRWIGSVPESLTMAVVDRQSGEFKAVIRISDNPFSSTKRRCVDCLMVKEAAKSQAFIELIAKTADYISKELGEKVFCIDAAIHDKAIAELAGL